MSWEDEYGYEPEEEKPGPEDDPAVQEIEPLPALPFAFRADEHVALLGLPGQLRPGIREKLWSITLRQSRKRPL